MGVCILIKRRSYTVKSSDITVDPFGYKVLEDKLILRDELVTRWELEFYPLKSLNVSQLVLLDSNFASMPKIVAEGRRSINNIQRSSSLFLVKTIVSVILWG